MNFNKYIYQKMTMIRVVLPRLILKNKTIFRSICVIFDTEKLP